LPPEKVIKRSAISDKALFRTEAHLKGSVLYLQEVVGSEGADFTIRVLQSAQYLEYEVTEKMPDGSMGTVVHRREGTVVVVCTTTKIRLFHENNTRVLPIYVDESEEQTRRIVERQLQTAKGEDVSSKEREHILEAWHDAIRLLEPEEVVIPYADRIQVPTSSVRIRRDIGKVLDVVRIIAWLHQHRRERDEQGRIIATEGDFRKALGLIDESLRRVWKSLSPAEEDVMKAVLALPQARQQNGFGRKDLVVEGENNRWVQEALKSLASTGYLDCDGKRGPQGYRYTLARDPEKAALGISLSTPCTTERDEDEGEARGSRGIARVTDRAVESTVFR